MGVIDPVQVAHGHWVQPIPSLHDIEWPDELMADYFKGDEDALLLLKVWVEAQPPYILTDTGIEAFVPHHHNMVLRLILCM